MPWILGILLLLVPTLEIWCVVQMGISLSVLTVWSLLTAAVGWYFARRESLSFWSELESDVQNGRLPTIEGVDTMLVLFGGWALIVPGPITDLAGAALLAPPLRRELTDWIRRTIRTRYL